ncbi:MAG: hypothetical protein EAZ32_03265 [Cytophagia bacterium]|nr:MAG: hypothetical protein EAZ38_06060 [Cytophagales bacterium]TAG41374.1 MAG: hypothetical protein EAZ32_03265 [Cytophagia bacterium]TAG83132.1 MAG: hypothetical protein EAZ22_03635 [Cytophagales bacterium]
MKKTLLTFYSTLCILNSTLAQTDSLRYTQESGTLKEQRFIDRYDYVFMTKEPTKWMLKAGYSSGGTMSGQFVQYENKLSPSFSVGLGAYFERSINSGFFGEIRWYYEMKKRIAENKSANNFSGNYFGFFSAYNTTNQQIINLYQSHPVGARQSFEIRWGLQRRFFNHGFADLGISLGGISSQKLDYNYPVTAVLNSGIKANFFLQTNWRMGVAWGDFKPSKNIPTCEILRCYDTQKDLLKIAWPSITLGFNQFNLNMSIAYEHKLGKTPFSLNLQTDFRINGFVMNDINFVVQNNPTQTEKGNILSVNSRLSNTLQPRFYLNHRRRLLEGKEGLWGWYLAASLSHIYSNSSMKFNSSYQDNRTYSYLTLGPTAGFQQKIFKHGYLDFNATMTRPIHVFSNNLNIGDWVFSPNLRLGFAF